MLLLTLIANALSFKFSPLTNTSFIDMKGFTDIHTQNKTMGARFRRTWVCCREGDIGKKSSMNAFAGGDRSDWKTEMSIPKDINSKIIFIPAKINIIETVQFVKITLKVTQPILGVYHIALELKRSAGVG